MARERILTLIMAGGAGGRLEVLTQERAKPAVPYAGVYRLVDFPLSNCMHSGLTDVWIVEQYQPHSLNEHLANGRPWDLDRTYGGLLLLPPYQGREESGWQEGNADAIHRHRTAIRRFDPDTILVLSADHVYKLDFHQVLERHREREADVTLVTTRVPLDEAGRYGTVQTDGEGRVTGFEYKPDSPRSDIVTTEVFVYNARTLLGTLDRLAAEAEDGDGATLKDFGHALLPELVRAGRAWEFRLDGYWRDAGTVESYWQGHMDLLEPEPVLALDDPEWPILTLGVQRLPARVFDSARIDNSLIAPGCRILGRVVRSVLSPGVVIEEGAEVRDSILLHDAHVGAGATVNCAILDKEVRVGAVATVGSDGGADNPAADAIVMAGQRATIAAGARVPPGARIAPGETAEDGK